MINITKKDIFWSYLASFFNLTTNILILPLVLKMLTKEEIGLNYILTSILSVTILFDFGFSVQFSRNFSYILSGAQFLIKDGIDNTMTNTASINYKLLSTLMLTSKYVYFRISIIALFFISTFGSFYIYKITKDHFSLKYVLVIWVIFLFTIFFNLYYSYLQSFLRGAAFIKQLNIINVFSRIFQLVLTILLLKFNLGLLGLIIANLVYPFFSRFLIQKFLSQSIILNKMNFNQIHKIEIIEMTKIVWHNSKKLGLVFLGSFLINKVGFLIAGFFLPLEQLASYGLMEQLFGIVISMSGIYFNTNLPAFSNFVIRNEFDLSLDLFVESLIVFYFLFFAGTISIFLIAPFLLELIGSNVKIPNYFILSLYSFIILLEQNHSLFATFITTKNKVPFLIPSLLSGILISIGISIWFLLINRTILGLIIVPGIIQIIYNNWKWPFEVFKDYNISFLEFYKKLLYTFLFKLKSLYNVR